MTTFSTISNAFRFLVRYVANKVMNKGLALEKVIVFDETGTADTYSECASTELSLKELKELISIDEYKIEFRYTVNGKKFRAIVREDDDVKFPIRKELGLVPTFDMARAFVFAKDGRHMDVTTRVRKYAGQNGDFNAHAGSLLFASDMFPYHDVEEFHCVVLVDDHNKTRVFRMNDIVSTN